MEEDKSEISLQLLCNACLCVGTTLYQIKEDKLKQYYLGALSEIPLYGVPNVLPTICWDCKALLWKAINFREQVKDSFRILMTYTSENLHECLLTDVSRPPRLKITNVDSVTIDPGCNHCDEVDRIDSSVNNDDDVQTNQGLKDENKTQKAKAEPTRSYNQVLLKSLDVGLQQTQRVFVKEELKDEDWASDRDFSDEPLEDNLKSVQIDNLANIDDEIRTIITEVEKNRDRSKKKVKVERSKSKNGKVRRKKVKKIKKEVPIDIPSILTIDLTYEEMIAEREKDIAKDSYVNAEYKCDTCIIGFNYHKSFKTHLSTKHSSDIGDFICPICNTVLSSVDSFTAHYKRHMRRYECSICKKRTMDLKVMQQHYYSTHEISLKKYKCGDCGKISDSVDSHRYHTDTHKSRLQCSECDKTFRHRGGLLNHRLTVHEMRNIFPCNHCDKVFRWKNSLKRHLEVHEAKKSTSEAAYCSLCSVSFASLASLQRHMNNSLKHVTKDDFRFICDHCNRRFVDKTKLRDHIEEKHLHKTYQCNICLKVSKNRVNLDQHIRNVHKGRPNNKMCHHCGKGFPTKVQLDSHMRTHTGERPFICEYCPTTFSQQSNLYKHNRQVHLNMKTKRYPITKKRKDERPAELSLEHSGLPIQYNVDIEFPL